MGWSDAQRRWFFANLAGASPNSAKGKSLLKDLYVRVKKEKKPSYIFKKKNVVSNTMLKRSSSVGSSHFGKRTKPEIHVLSPKKITKKMLKSKQPYTIIGKGVDAKGNWAPTEKIYWF